MMKKFFEEMNRGMRFKIEEIEWNDPVLHIGGRDWGFNTMSAWRIIKNGKLLCCSEDKNSSIINEFKNQYILEIKAQSTQLPIDIAMFIDADRTSDKRDCIIEIFSGSFFEPWTFGYSKPVVYVSSPGDPNCLC